jgi:hypothetical protein
LISWQAHHGSSQTGQVGSVLGESVVDDIHVPFLVVGGFFP